MNKAAITFILLLLFFSCTPLELDNPADRENIDYTAPRLIFVSKGEQGFVRLTWGANQNYVSQYIILRGTGPESLSEIERVDGSDTSFTDRMFSPPETHFYYYAIKAVLIAGEVSRQSNSMEGYIYKTRIPFKDSNLENAVREAIGNGETFIGDGAGLTTFEASGKNIADLQGIEYLCSLTKLNLGNNHIGRLAGLEHLTGLQRLSLNNNRISDIDNLKNLFSLTELNLSDNMIEDIRPLGMLPGLHGLNLADNMISDLTPLINNDGIGSGDRITLNNNPLSIEAIMQQVDRLRAKGTGVDEAAVLPFTFPDAALEAAVRASLGIPEGQIFYRDAAKLTTLAAGGKNITDLTGINRLSSLTELTLDHNNITSIKPLGLLKKLEHLDLFGNRICDLSPLLDNEGIGRGDSVEVKGNPLNTAAVTLHIPALAKKGVLINEQDFTPVVFSDPVLEAAVREAIGKPDGQICVYDVAGKISLSLENKNISTLGGLEHFVSLTELNLTGNKITDLSPLLDNEGIGAGDILKLKNNPLSKDVLEKQIPLLKQKGVDIDQLTVMFPDPGLEAAVRKAINKIEGDIYITDVNTLKSLYAGNKNIINLSGIWFLSALTTLDLSDNKISDISGLSSLQSLTTLKLRNNRIIDPGSLGALGALTTLELDHNYISDLSSLGSLGALKKLNLGFNHLSDLSGLNSLSSLEALNLYGNYIGNLSTLGSLPSLTVLTLSHNTNITDLSSLGHFPSLITLDLSNTNTADLSSLGHFPSLTTLDLSNTNIADLSSLGHFPSLTTLDLSNTNIADLSSLQSFRALKKLDLSGTKRCDLTTLDSHPSLETLNLLNTNTTDLSSLQSFRALKELNLSENNIDNLDSLPPLPALRELDLSRNSIDNLDSLPPLPALRELDLSRNSITDLKGLRTFPLLLKLYLIKNNISDLSSLPSLPSLRVLDLKENRISDLSILINNEDIKKGIDWIELTGNPLSNKALSEQLPVLKKLCHIYYE